MTKVHTVTITAWHLDVLERHRIFTTRNSGLRLKMGDKIRCRTDMRIEPYFGLFRGYDFPKSAGAFSYSHSELGTEVNLGRYCSIAPNVRILGTDHPHQWVSTSPFSYTSGMKHSHLAAMVRDSKGKRFKPGRFMRPDSTITIENDVWIGQDVLLARGITIGTGSVVAAGSVVVKNVEPYSIVGGAPAKLIRKRFEAPVADGLLASGWWNYSFMDFAGLPMDQPEAFLEGFNDAVRQGRLQPFLPNSLGLADFMEAAVATI